LCASSRIFSTFSVILLVLGHPKHSLSSTDTQLALKRECHSKISIQLKECSPEASQSISMVSVVDLLSFTQNLMKIHSSILPSIAEKNKTRSRKNTPVKTMHVHSAVSSGILMQ
jgi:hypothetical protein